MTYTTISKVKRQTTGKNDYNSNDIYIYIQGFYKSKMKHHQLKRKNGGGQEHAVHRDENTNGS